jgi:predicted aspartyl protease
MGAPCAARSALVALVVVVAGLVLATSARESRADVLPPGVPLTVDEQGGLLVPALAAGRPVMLLLDTGASHSSLRPELARTLGLAPAGDVTMHALGTTRRVPLARLPVLAVGFAEVADLRVLLFDPAVDEVGGQRVDGVLGQDVLGRYNYSLDRRRRRLVIEVGDELQASVGGAVLRFSRIGDRPAVDIVLNGARDRPVALALDSGASHLVLFDRGEASRFDHLEMGVPARVETQAGPLAARAARVRLLEAGASSFHEVTGVVVDAGAREEDGLLPLGLFDEVYVNNRLGWLVLNPRWDAKARRDRLLVAGIPAARLDMDR